VLGAANWASRGPVIFYRRAGGQEEDQKKFS
jgi:hypothetical protein